MKKETLSDNIISLEEYTGQEEVDYPAVIKVKHVKASIKRLKKICFDNRTISAARAEDCVLIETLNALIDEEMGDELTK